MSEIYKAIDIGLPPRATGTVPPAEVVSLSGLDFLRSIGDGERPMPPMAGVIPVRPIEVEFGRIVFEGHPAAEGFLRDAEGRLLAHGTTTCMVFAAGR